MSAKSLTGTNIRTILKDCTINYDDLGTGAVPLIFIHGFPFDKTTWTPQLEQLKHSHRVIAYDIRGFGESTAGIEKASIRLFADDLLAFMEQLKIKKAVVCGLSMGGYILLQAALSNPERFNAIILCDTQCTADAPEGKEKRSKTIALIEAGGVKDYAESSLPNLLCRETLQTRPELADAVRNLIVSTPLATLTGTLRALAERPETCSMLHKLNIPTLLLCGKEDVITPLAQAEFMQNRIANSTLRSIHEAGHLSNLEQPEEFNRLVLEFLSGLPGT